MADLATLKIVVDSSQLAAATTALNKFANDVSKTEENINKQRKTATDASRKAQEELGRQIIATTKNTYSFVGETIRTSLLTQNRDLQSHTARTKSLLSQQAQEVYMYQQKGTADYKQSLVQQNRDLQLHVERAKAAAKAIAEANAAPYGRTQTGHAVSEATVRSAYAMQIREESAAIASMDMAARRAAESKGILAKYSHQLQRTLLDLTPIISGVGLLTLAHGAIQATDKYTKLTSQLKIATNSTAEYGQALSEVKRISSAAQADITAITSLYQRLSLATEASGVSQSEIAMITETVALGLKANGASARESASAMLQLSQSFGSGRMAGEEFNSMAEAAPNVLRALAKSMGVPYGQLKTLASETKITTAVMVKAFTDPALLEAFRAQAASMRTITGSWVELTNALVLYVGEGSKSSGATKVLSGTLSFLADNLKAIADGIIFAASMMTLKFSVSILQAAADFVLLEGAATKAITKITALSVGTKAGLIGLALFAMYEVADYMGLIDRIFIGAEERIKKLRADILSVREIESQKKGKTGNDKFNVVPGLVEDAVAIYAKSIGKVNDDMSNFIKSDSFIFGKDFLSKEQENAAKAKELYATLNSEIDKLWNMKGISTENRIKAEIQLRETYIEKLADLNKKETSAAGKAAKAAAKEVAASQAKIAVMNIEMATGNKLTDSQKKLIELGYEQAQSALKTTDAKYAENAARLAGVAVIEMEKAAYEAAIKENEHYIDGLIKSADGINKETESIANKLAAVELETASIGKTKEEIALLEAARYDHTTQIMQEQLAIIELTGVCTAESAALEEAIAVRERYKKAKTDQGAAQAQQAIIDAETKAYKEQWKMIDGFAHDAFDNILDKGKNVFKELGNAIKKYLLDMLYKMTLQKWIIPVSITGGMAASGMASAATGNYGGGTGLMDIASSGLGMAMSGLTASQSLAAASAYGSAALSATSLAEGISMATSGLSLAMPYIGAALAVYSLFKGNKSTPTTSLGHAVTSFSATGQQTGTQSLYGGTSASVDAQIASLQTGYMKAAMALGIGATAQQWGFAMNTGANGQKQMFGLSGGGFVQGETALSDAELQLAASRAVFSALQGSELPQYLSRMFDGLTASTMTQADIDNTLAFAGSVKQMRDALLETRTPLEVLRANVAAGTVAFATSAATFRTDFVAAIDAGINPQVFEQWKALGTAIDQLAAADTDIAAQNTETLARAAEDAVRYQTTMLDLQGQISELNGNELMVTAVLIEQRKIAIAELNASDPTGYLAALTNQLWGLQDAAKSAATAAALANTNLGWQQQIDVLLGTQTQRQVELANALEGADASTVLLINQLFGLQDAADAAAISTQAAADAESELKSLRDNIISAYAGFVSRAQAAADAVISAQQAITNGYLAAQDKVASIQQRIADISKQAAQEMRGFADGIREFIFDMRTSDLGGSSKASQFAAMLAAFTITTAQASAGDTNSLGSMTGQAQSLLDIKRVTATSAFEYAQFAGQIAGTLNEVATLADGKAGPLAEAVDPMTQALADLSDAQSDLVRWQQATSESGASTERVLIDYAADWRLADAANVTAQAELLEVNSLTQNIDMQQLTELQKIRDLVGATNNILLLQAQAAAAAGTLTTGMLSGLPGNTLMSSILPQSTPTPALDAARIEANLATQQAGNVARTAMSAGQAGADLLDVQDLFQHYLGRSALQGGMDYYTNLFGPTLEAAEILAFSRDPAMLAERAARGLPAFAVGTNEVPFDMTARIHAGEEIKPRQFVQKDNKEREETNALLKKLVAANDDMKKELVAIKKSNEKIWQIDDKHDIEGMPAVRT